VVAAYKEIPAACQMTSNPFQPRFASWEVDIVKRRDMWASNMLSKAASPFIPARQLLVRRKIRERDDFQGRFIVPSREFTSVRMLFFTCLLNMFPLFL
jgi:hypothetical protein